tara:strand:- start:36 stop:788 length:753 start_codon:yes stop_codon:yes gene_type:complete
MNFKISKNEIERFSRQVVLKHIGVLGQKKIIKAKVLIVGMGGLGCPVAEFLTRAGVGCLGIIDFDKVALSNIHRQCLYDYNDIGKFKVETAKIKIKRINTKTKVKTYKLKLDEKNITKIINKYDFIVDGSDNFKTKFLLNDFCIKNKKILVTGAISKFDGHLFTFNFKKKSTPCLRCFFQEEEISDDILNCESEGIIGSVAGTIGTVQANEVLKQILEIGKNLVGFILIIDLLNLDFRKVKLIKQKKCIC